MLRFSNVAFLCYAFMCVFASFQSGIFEYNGSAVVAMAGNGCVGIACDRRLGHQQLQTVSAKFQKVFPINSSTLVGIGGLATDVQSL